jgi:hypothetical protein
MRCHCIYVGLPVMAGYPAISYLTDKLDAVFQIQITHRPPQRLLQLTLAD